MQPTTIIRLAIVAAVVLTVSMIGAVVALEVFRSGDNAIAIGHVLTVGVPTVTVLIAFIQSANSALRTQQRLEDLHEAVNGRMDQQLEQARAAGRMEARRQPGKDEV